MGLDVGEAAVTGTSTSGSVLNVAARLCSAAGPGEVLTTEHLVHLAGPVPGVTFEHGKRLRLKGVPGRVPTMRLASAAQEKGQLERYRAALDAATGPPRSPRRAVVAGMTAVAVVLAAGAVWLAGRPSTPVTIPGGTVGILDATTGQLKGTLAAPTGARPTGVVVGAQATWLINGSDGSVSRADPDKAQVVQTIPVGTDPVGAVEVGDVLYVVNRGSNDVTRISLRTNEPIGGAVDVGNQPSAIAWGFDHLWVTNRADATITRIDVATGDQVTKTVGAAPARLAIGTDAVWVTASGDNTVVAVDPQTVEPRQFVHVGAGPEAVVAQDGEVFVANRLALTLSRVDQHTAQETAQIPVGDSPSSIAVAGGELWVTNQAAGTLSKVSRADARTTLTWSLGSSPLAIAIHGDRLLVAAASLPSGSHVGGTLNVVAHGPLDRFDPTVGSDFPAMQTYQLVWDGLVATRRTSGPEASDLVPDLAVSLPQPTNGGLTYRFTLRSGIRFSDGTPLRAQDVKRGIERSMALPPQAVDRDPYYAGIARIVADDGAGTVLIDLTAPDPDFLAKLALPYASALPPDADMTHPDPLMAGTGPYMIESIQRGPDFEAHAQLEDIDPNDLQDSAFLKAAVVGVTLVRNPYFTQWSSAAQPAGYPDTISMQFTGSLDTAMAAYQAGTADLVELGVFRLLGADVSKLTETYPGLAHVDGTATSSWIVLDTTSPPFDNVRARRALATALDRTALAADFDVLASCHVLPAGLPAADPTACPSPSLTEAKRLVRLSGTQGQRVAVPEIYGGGFARWGKFFDDVSLTLDQLGYEVVRTPYNEDSPKFFFDVGGPDHRIDLTTNGVVSDFASAAHFYPQLSCASYAFCSPKADSLARAAHAADVSGDPATAVAEWRRVYERIEKDALVIPYSQSTSMSLLSPRANPNFQSSWLTGPILSQLWVQ